MGSEYELAVARTAVPRLTAWGVSADADLIYRTLVEHGPQNEDDLRRALGMPARRMRIALDELVGTEVAALTCVRQKPRRWRHRPPEAVVATLRARRRLAAAATLNAHRRLATIADLDPGSTGRALIGPARIRSRLAELVRATRHEHLSMHPEPVFDPAAVKVAAPLDHDLLDRGVDLLSLGVPPVADDTTAAHGLELDHRGLRYRELPVQPTKMIIFDRRVAILPLDPIGASGGALELTGATTVQNLAEWFMRRWDLARSPQPRLGAAVELTDRERAIIALLAAGHTDSSAADQLGLSLRTVAYTIRGLMDRYGVQNRFQLGMVVGALRRVAPDTDSEGDS
jgi:DNA-binding CsgD family transcriptional regulator/sugar-specific transcriptional regulator TrmB